MTARELDRWIRRALLASVPAMGLSGCIWGPCPDWSTVERTLDPETFNELVYEYGMSIPAGVCELHCAAEYGVRSCALGAGEDGQPILKCERNVLCVGGRRPESFLDDVAAPSVGEWLASLACLESASVEAFQILARELKVHGAPVRLQRAALRAVGDEVRHAELTAALASRYHCEPKAAGSGPPRPVRSLAAIAAENAAEGCVRETYGAVVAHWQTRHAADPAIRRAMRTIAADETRHAALAWQVHAWAMPRLAPPARKRVLDARRAAADELERNAQAPISETFVNTLGLPDPARAAALVAGLARDLWSEKEPATESTHPA